MKSGVYSGTGVTKNKIKFKENEDLNEKKTVFYAY